VLLYRGKRAEAVGQAERAAADDPYNSLVLGIYGQFLNFIGRYHEAEAAFQLALQREPNDPISLSNFRTTYHLLERFDEAIPLWRDYYLRVMADTLAVAALERGYSEGGYTAALRAVGDEFSRREDERLNWQIATLYTRAGDRDRALDYLEKATAVRDPNMPYIIVDPIFDYLRGEPRFQALLDTLGAFQ
jgi:tetratricopeptide (TPR) repeat protein